MHYARADRRQLEHLVVLDVRQLAGGLHHSGVRGEDPVDVGVDLARVCAQRGGERDRGRVGATAPECRYRELLGDALEAGDHRHLLSLQSLEDAVGLDVADAGPRVMPARSDAGLRARQRHRRHAHALQAHRDQRRGDRLAIGDEHVELARGRFRVDALRKRDQTVGRVTHRGHHRDDLVALPDRVGDAAADTTDARCGPHRGPAVLLDDHNVRNMPLSVILLTSARPRSGCASSIASAIRVACEGAQKANTLGPAPQMAAPYAPAASATLITSSTHGYRCSRCGWCRRSRSPWPRSEERLETIARTSSAVCAALNTASESATSVGSAERAFSVGTGWWATKRARPQPGFGSFSSTCSETMRIPPDAEAATLSRW